MFFCVYVGAAERDNPPHDIGIFNAAFKANGKPMWSVDEKKAYDYQIGDLGITIELKVNSKHCKVLEVNSGTAGSRAGFKKGDMVVKIDGNDISTFDIGPLSWKGESPLVDFGRIIQEKRSFRVSVKRANKTEALTVNIDKKYKEYSDKLSTCARADEELTTLMKYLKGKAGPNGYVGANGHGPVGIINSAIYGLTIMNMNDKKAFKDCKRIFSTFKGIDPVSLNSNWPLCYYGTFMCEYYLKTKDNQCIKIIQEVVAELAKRTSDGGKHGHGGYEVGYDGGGINAITTHVYLVFVLAETCGIKVDEKKKKAVKNWLKSCTHGRGSVGYAFPGGSDAAYRTPICCIAYRLDGEKALAKKCADYMVENSGNMMSGHALGTIPLMWTFMALKGMKKDDYINKHFQNLHWFFNVSSAPKSYNSLHRFYVTGPSNDAYFVHTVLNHTIHAMIFSLKSAGLAMTSGSNANLDIIAMYSKIYKNRDELVDALEKNVEALSSIEKIGKTMEFFGGQARNNEKAAKIYGGLKEKLMSYQEDLEKLALVRPAYSYSCFRLLEKTFQKHIKDRNAHTRIKKIFLRDSDVRKLESIRQEIDRIVEKEQKMDKLASKLGGVQRQLAALLKKRQLNSFVRYEAIFIMKRLEEMTAS